jgi:hypothetical protein
MESDGLRWRATVYRWRRYRLSSIVENSIDVAEAKPRIATIRLVVPKLALSSKSATAGAAYQLIYRPVLRLPLTLFRGFRWHSIALLLNVLNVRIIRPARTNTKAVPREKAVYGRQATGLVAEVRRKAAFQCIVGTQELRHGGAYGLEITRSFLVVFADRSGTTTRSAAGRER